jgi:hypothetical protein
MNLSFQFVAADVRLISKPGNYNLERKMNEPPHVGCYKLT